MATEVTKEIVEELGEFLAKYVRPKLKEINYEWPEPNRTLKFPSLTIMASNPVIRPEQPTIYVPPGETMPVPDQTTKKVDHKYITGNLEWNIDLMFWHQSKNQLHELYEAFSKAMITQYISGAREVPGVVLTLEKYHKVCASYVQIGYDWPNDEESSRKREWRFDARLLASAKRVFDKSDFAMLNFELQSEISPEEVGPIENITVE